MSAAKPWYREPWPWILMSGPAAVLVAGTVTMWLAYASADGLVADDYYRQGLAINRVLAREDAARRLGISAEVRMAPGKLSVALRGEAPDVVFVRLAHATRAGHDLRLRLARTAPGSYEAALPPLPAGHWHVSIEDAPGRWRVAEELR
jgi:hypothetical protein